MTHWKAIFCCDLLFKGQNNGKEKWLQIIIIYFAKQSIICVSYLSWNVFNLFFLTKVGMTQVFGCLEWHSSLFPISILIITGIDRFSILLVSWSEKNLILAKSLLWHFNSIGCSMEIKNFFSSRASISRTFIAPAKIQSNLQIPRHVYFKVWRGALKVLWR